MSVKQLYLCSSCKKSGVRSIRSKVFESFFCPKCKKDTTLFLPKEKFMNQDIIPMENKIRNPKKEENHTMVEEEKCIEIQDSDLIQENETNMFSIRDVVTFMLGFIIALFIMKICL